MKIVVLDGYTLNPGDLNWERMKQLGELTVHERTPQNRTLERSEGAEIIFTNKTVLTEVTISDLPDLRYIGVLATGFNVVDIEAARKRGIAVTNIPGYGTRSVAQMVFAHILNHTQQVDHHARTVREGRWSNSRDFCYWDFPLIELTGLTMGIIGFGRIGRATADLARAFGMKVLAYSPRAQDKLAKDIEMVGLDELFSQSDFVSLHCPLTPENTHLVDAGRIALMKSTAYLVNTSRGALVDEGALYHALKYKQIAGAGLDVLESEPPVPDNPLLKLENCYITPHIAWATQSARARLMHTAVENLQAFLNGRPQNVINS